MEVRISKAFRAVPNGDVYPREFKVGETVNDRMAEIARALGCADDDPVKKKGGPRGGNA